MHLKTLFSTPARAWPLWVLGLWGHFTIAPRWLVMLSVQSELGWYDHEDVPGVAIAPMSLPLFTAITAPFWIRFLRKHLRDYPGHVPLWIWRADRAERSAWYTILCALACAWSIKMGFEQIETGLHVMSVFYFGCTVMWVSLRAVMLGKLQTLSAQNEDR